MTNALIEERVEPLSPSEIAEFAEMVKGGRVGFVNERERLAATMVHLEAERVRLLEFGKQMIMKGAGYQKEIKALNIALIKARSL